MVQATTIGLDIAKQVFQVHGADRAGKAVLRRKLKRSEVARFFSEQPPCLVGIEASGSAHYWSRVISGFGHTVRLMAPQFVKPYVKSQKNDANDAEAIAEAVTRPNMRYVPQKTVEQQDLQCLHRVRSRLVACRTQLINQIRGLRAGFPADELARDVDVVALLEGLGDDGAFAEKRDRQELAVLHGATLGVVVPMLRQPGAHKDSPSRIGDRRLVGQVSGKYHLVKNFH